MHHRPACCTLVPPYILQAIAAHEDPALRAAAVATLGLDRTFATARSEAGRSRPRSITSRATQRLDRVVFDAQHTEQLPGTLVRRERSTEPVDDVAVNEAFDGLGATWRLFQEVYGRDSIDDLGLTLSGSVHFGDRYDNAYWDGTQMVFGDGDGELFNRFTIAVDVIGHELTHGVTAATADLVYSGQSGALNESISDVFGSLVKQHGLGQSAAEADWLIGEGLLAAGVQGRALRSMAAPGTAYDDPRLGGEDPQPAHMRDYVRTTGDNGGVHVNSGIPNRAFHLAAVALGGAAWERAGRIWYATLTSASLSPTATFAAFARLSVSAAGDLFDVQAADAVRGAWSQVGVVV